MELTPWKLIHEACTMDTSWNLHHGSYFMEFTSWKLPHGTYIIEVT